MLIDRCVGSKGSMQYVQHNVAFIIVNLNLRGRLQLHGMVLGRGLTE